MKTKLFTLLTLFFTATTYSQDNAVAQKLKAEAEKTIVKKVTDTANWTWLRGGSINVNGTQGSLKNWSAGGDKFSLAVNSYVNYFIYHRKGKVNWDNNLDFNFGMLKTTSLGVRKNDDRLDLLSKYGYNLGNKIYLTGMLNFRSQMFNGYTYTDTSKVFSSSFLSPAYALISAGLDYKPSVNFSIFVSPITSRLTIVGDKELSAIGAYGVAPGKTTLNEIGAFASVNWMQTIAANISYKGRLDMFSNYGRKPGNVDIFQTNFFSFKINKFFSATYNLDLIYDDDVRLFGKDGTSAGLQMKSLIGLGFNMKL